MFINWLTKLFIKNYDQLEREEVRTQYVYIAGIIGILANILLFIVKFSVGVLTGSIAVMADAFNNFSDTASSVITMIGVKLANLPADKEHPHGHGRLEYLSALLVAFMVMLVGVQFIKSSVERILNPSVIQFEIVSFILLAISVVVKLWLSRFNKVMGEKVNSSALKAASVDALGDVFTSSTVLISFLAARFTSFPVDGYAGVLVAGFILYAGYTLVKETISPLLGEAPDEELVNDIYERILSYDLITGAHDLVIHNYGVGRIMASIHAEIPADQDIMTIHDVIDQAEREISEALKLHLVVHMDPVCIETDEIKEMKRELDKIIATHPAILSMHDFRIIGHEPTKNLVFDLVVDGSKLTKELTEDQIKDAVITQIRQSHPTYRCVIVIDKAYL
ncbi:cation diffusion facilitator family transporter [Turicibacter sanguinis]|uniref:cation diffusion facilitator family transporter n=1 Tax=Turicibacter sanguinis TaxID=154288 RepID=UPI0021D5126F|nr:cation diffusion facilitator family transporter [Turicibacter sanguinis]MCU7192390.1 cation diffusion facilitator family transporter [Turicibacter sanguinis]